jgi:hypothetical protein
MQNGPFPQLPFPRELTRDEVRTIARRAIIECNEAKEKANVLIAKSHDLLRQLDGLLAKR